MVTSYGSHMDTFDDSSTSTTRWYLSQSQLCLIKRMDHEKLRVRQVNVSKTHSTPKSANELF